MEDSEQFSEISGLLREMGTGFEEFKARHNAEVEGLKDHIRELEAKANRPGVGRDTMSADEWSGTAPSSGWVDAKGAPVRVLRPEDRWAEAKNGGPSMGDVVRALVTGARSEAEFKALSEGTNSAGGFTVPSVLSGAWIDRLRASSVVVRAGARTVPMESSTLAIARLASDPAIGWRAENGNIAEGDPTFERVMFQAKSLAGIVKVSRELFADTVNAGAMLEQAILKVMGLELDRAAVWGDGADNSPTGVVNTSGINEVAMATNGGQLASYDKLIDALYELKLDNVPQTTAGILHPRTEAGLAKLKDANNNPLVPPKMVADVPLLSTTAAPINETQGTSSDASSIIYGDFSQLMIGMREDVNIRVLSEAFSGVGQIAILVHARADVQLAHAASFCRLKGIRP